MAGSLSWQRCSTVHPASLAKHPQTWTKEEIGAWLRWCSEEYSIEPIPPEKFDLNGKALCLLSRSDFMERVPRNGDVLYNCLQTLIAKHTGSNVLYQRSTTSGSNVQDVYQTLGGDQRPSKTMSSVSDQMTAAGFLLVPSSSSISPPASISSSTVPCTVSRSSFVPIKPHPYISIPVRHQQGDTTATLVRQSLHLGDPVFPGPSSMLEQHSHGNGHSLDPLRQDRSSDCRLLWEFIYQLLSNAKYSNYVCWEDKEEFVFRIINPTGLAELWGQQKNRTNMTYEKLSRALRYYYRMNIIKKVQGKRLTYRFLQPPSCIQKGQRGAKPHYKVQMDLMSGQGSHLSARKCSESSRKSSATATVGPGTKEEARNITDDEAGSEQGCDTDPEMSEQLGQDSGSSKSSRSSRSSPARRMSFEIEHMSEQQECASGSAALTNFSLASSAEAGVSYSSLTSFQHGIRQPSYLPMPSFSEKRCYPIVKYENFYTSPHTLPRANYFHPPRQSATSISPSREVKSEQEKLEVLEMRPFERNVRYPENIYRSLSSDFAQSLHVQPFSFRPNQPRSASPRCDVQQEPEDLSTRKRTGSDVTSTKEPFRSHSSSFSQYRTDSVTPYSRERADSNTSFLRDRIDSNTSFSRDNTDTNTSFSRDRTGSNTSFPQNRIDSNPSFSRDRADTNSSFSRKETESKKQKQS